MADGLIARRIPALVSPQGGAVPEDEGASHRFPRRELRIRLVREHEYRQDSQMTMTATDRTPSRQRFVRLFSPSAAGLLAFIFAVSHSHDG